MSYLFLESAMSPAGGHHQASPPRHALTPAPVWNKVHTWMLLWPLLTLIAGQVVYFSGPAREAAIYKNGAAANNTHAVHYDLYVYLLILAVFVATGWREVWSVLKRNPILAVLLMMAFTSILWTASVKITFQMSIMVTLCTLFCCYLGEYFPAPRLMSFLMLMGSLSALLSIAFVVALPSYGIFAGYAGHAWQGICNQKNTLGVSMAFLLSPALFIKQCSLGRRLAYSSLMLFLIAMSQSRGAWAYTTAMLLFAGWLALMRRLRSVEVVILLLLTVVGLLGLAALGVEHFAALATALGKDPTMSGRLQVYSEVWRSIMKRPLLGYALGGFWYPGSLESQRIGLAIHWSNIGYAENGFLEVALQLGFLGVGLLLLMLARAALQAIRLLRSPAYTPQVGWYLTILFLVLCTNVDAGWFMNSDTLEWAFVVLACTGLEREHRRAAVSIPSSVFRTRVAAGLPQREGLF